MKRQRYSGGAQSAGPPRKVVVRRARPAVPRAVTLQQLRAMLGQETHFTDNVYSGAVVATAAGAEADPATFLCLNNTAYQTGPTGRDGERVKLVSTFVRGDVVFTASTNLDGYVRILLVQDNQTNGAQLNSEDVLVDGAGTDVQSLRELSYVKRFRVLKEIIIKCDGRSAATATYTVPFTMFHKFGKAGVDVNFTNNQNNITAIQDVSIHVIAIASDASMATLRYQSRSRFMP